MKSSSMKVLASENLTYKGSQDSKLDGFTFLIKDEKGLLKMVSGDELEDESIKTDFSKLNEDKKSLKENSLQTSIILEKDGFEKLYIPVTFVSDDAEIKSIDKNSSLEFIEFKKEKQNDNLILTSVIDVNDLEDIKNVNVEFFKNGSNDKSQLKVLKVVKTDGNKEEDISLTTPYFRVKDDFDKYKDLSKDEISKEMKDLDILNPFTFSSTLETGYNSTSSMG